VLAAGGIVDASGILALGAEGVVMGTRFVTTPEFAMKDNAKALILQPLMEKQRQNDSPQLDGY
jgi:nitronate monooxygenase